MFKSAEKIGKLLVGGKPNNTTRQEKNSAYVYFQIKPFKDNENGIGHRETISKNLISLKKKKICFFITGNSVSIKFFVIVPKDFKQFFQNIFYNSYPTSDLIEVDPFKITSKKEFISFSDAKNINEKMFFTREGSYMDPMGNILSLYNTVGQKAKLEIFFSYTFKVSKNMREHMGSIIKRARNSKKREEKDEAPEIKEEPEVFTSIAFKVHSQDAYEAETIRSNIRSAFSPFTIDGKIKLRSKEIFTPMRHIQSVNFFHIPTKANFIKGLDYTVYRKLPYPTNMPTPQNSTAQDLTILGTTDYRGEKNIFGIKKDDKFRHMYIVGKTGTGKSTFIANMLKSDMEAGNGLALLDPHGELVDIVLEHIPTNRINDVILFDVADSDFPIGFNLLQADTEEGKNLVASGVVATFYRLFGTSRGPRLEYILRNVVISLVDYPNATLMHILRILTDKNFREEVISNVKDAVVLKFRQTEFNKWNDKQRDEAIGPITNKVGQFLSSKLVRNIFGQPRTKLSLRKAMDEGKIILVNLSKGRIGEDNANMIGSLLVTKFQIDAMSRADIPASQRRDFYLYIDEFQNFASTSFTTILSEARKYKLSLIVANQYTSQLLPEIKDALFGNVGTTISFTLGHDDAVILAAQFKEMVSTNDLISLPKFTAYTRLMVDGVSSDPFSMKTLPISTPEGSLELIDKIRKQSRQRYAMSKAQLEKLMEAWSNKTFSAQEKIAEKAKMEAMGIESKEAEDLQDSYVQDHLHYFTEYAIDGVEPDAIIFDTMNYLHKAVRYNKPKGIEDQSQLKSQKGQKVGLKNGAQVLMHVDIYQHGTINTESQTPLMIRIGTKKEALKQLEEIYAGANIQAKDQIFLKFCSNIHKLEAQLPPPPSNSNTETVSEKNQSSSKRTTIKPEIATENGFTIKDIKLGERYEGYIKLSYNYGMFVTVKGVEGLLHKNFIIAPDGVEWKKYYNIGDKIKVKAKEFKEVNGEQKVVRSQK